MHGSLELKSTRVLCNVYGPWVPTCTLCWESYISARLEWAVKSDFDLLFFSPSKYIGMFLRGGKWNQRHDVFVVRNCHSYTESRRIPGTCLDVPTMLSKKLTCLISHRDAPDSLVPQTSLVVAGPLALRQLPDLFFDTLASFCSADRFLRLFGACPF